MTKKERLEAIISHYSDGRPTQFAKYIGVAPSTISSWLSRNSFDYDLLFAKCEDISSEWLLTGKGDMLKGDNSRPTEAPEAVPEANIKQIHTPKYTEAKRDYQEIPLYDFMASAGLREILDNGHNYIIDTIKIPNLPKCDGAIRITGDSMTPILKSGDTIIYKVMPLNIQDLFYGQMYLVSYEVDGDYYVVVKYIRKSPQGEPFITLASENPEHADKDIAFSRINALALIKASISVNTMM